jgi:hypothetical protein
MLVRGLHRQTILAINELLAAQRRFTLRRLPRIVPGAKCIIQLRRFGGFGALENAMKLGFGATPRAVVLNRSASCGCANAMRQVMQRGFRAGTESSPPAGLVYGRTPP